MTDSKQEVFEVHITSSNPYIHHLCKVNGIKSIEIELLTPQGEVLRTEHMTSHVFKCDDLTEAIKCVGGLVSILSTIDLTRIKVECPQYPQYRHHAIYVEYHAKNDTFELPTSRNKKSGKLLATSRAVIPSMFDSFLKHNSEWPYEKREVEMCLLDTFVDEDRDWLSLWGQ